MVDKSQRVSVSQRCLKRRMTVGWMTKVMMTDGLMKNPVGDAVEEELQVGQIPEALPEEEARTRKT